MTKPMANGIINLNDIRLESEVLPLRIKKLNAKVIVHGTHAQFKGLLSTGYNISTIPKNDAPRENILTKSLVFIDKSIKKSIYVITNSGHKKSLPKLTAIAPGTAEIQGYFDWKKHYKGRLDLIANKIELYEYGKIDLLVTPKITLHIGKELNLSGYIYIDQGRIKIKEIPEGAIAVSEDVVVVDEKRKTISTMLPLKIALKLDLGKNLKIDAFGLQSNLEGLLRINKQKRQDINLHGELRIVSGSYRALGQRLILRNSRMNFTGPPESPYISIEAIRPPEKTKDGVIAGVRVTGLPDDLKLVIFADPAKTQQNAISYITTGKSIENSSGTSNSQIATLLIGIGAGQTSGVLNNAGNTVGISDLSISSKGYGVEQSIGLSGYILPGVQVSYGVGIFDSFNIVAINYEVFKNFYIEVSSGLNQAIDAYYNFELN
jgi:translocation and assembly module TamB